MSQAYGMLQFLGYELLRFLHLLLAYYERGEAHLVKPFLVAEHCLVAFTAHVLEHSCHDGTQIGSILVRAL